MAVAHAAWDREGVSILVVDDARFTCEMIRRALRGAGYQDLRVTSSAREGLAMFREREAHIVLADWLMPEIDGLALTRRIRELDRDHGRYTYVMLLTAKEGTASLTEAFAHGVDDFISKSPDHQELLARIGAATRIVRLHSQLQEVNSRLQAAESGTGDRRFDPATGLGNEAYLRDRLQALLRHVASRGGSGVLVLIRLGAAGQPPWTDDPQRAGEVVREAATRLQQAVRPLDTVARIGETEFAALMIHHHTEPPHVSAFRRLHRMLGMRAYRTYSGFVDSVTAPVSVVSFGTEASRGIGAEDVLAQARAALTQAETTGHTVLTRVSGAHPGATPDTSRSV